MQFCQEHWDALRRAIALRGMEHLVARSGEEALEDAVAQLEGTATQANWDPLMAAHWAIFNRVLARVGLAALSQENFCPLCAVQGSYDYVVSTQDPVPASALDAQGWIDSCADYMLQHARQLGLMPEVQ